jgi:hypothetical protein
VVEDFKELGFLDIHTELEKFIGIDFTQSFFLPPTLEFFKLCSLNGV